MQGFPCRKNLLQKMRYHLENAFSHIRQAGITNLMSLLSIAFTTVLLSILLLNHTLIAQQLALAKDAPTLVASLKDTVNEAKGRAFVSQIEKDERISSVYYVSKEEESARGETEFKDLGKLIKDAFPGVVPFQASLEIYIDEEIVTRRALERIALDIKAYDEIEDVILKGQGVLNELLRDATRITFAGIAIAIAVGWLIIRYSLGKTMAARKDEFALIELLGAFPRYLLIPLLTHGIFLAAFGTTCGLGVFYGLFLMFRYQLGAMQFLPIYQLIAIVAGGIIIGTLAGIFAHRKLTRK